MNHPRNRRPTLVGLPRPQTILPPPIDEAESFPLTRKLSYIRDRTNLLHRPMHPARPELAGFGPAHLVAAAAVCAAVMAALRLL